MSLSPEQLLEWADKVEEATITDEVERMIRAMQRATPPFQMPQIPAPHIYTQPRPDCGCPHTGICMSTACPRAIKITCDLGRPLR